MYNVSCPKCGHQAAADASACPECGHSLNGQAPAEDNPVKSPPRPVGIPDGKVPPELREWAQSQRSDLVVTSKSEPEPVMLAHNLVAELDDIEVARELVRKWERIQSAEAGVGFVAMGRPETGSPQVARAVRRNDPATPKTDPEKLRVAAAKLLELRRAWFEDAMRRKDERMMTIHAEWMDRLERLICEAR